MNHIRTVLGGLVLLLMLPAVGNMQSESPPFDLRAALSRVPLAEWNVVAFTDMTSTMEQLGASWIPESITLNDVQMAGWEGVWKPNLFSMELDQLGISRYHIEHMVEARHDNGSVLWLEGVFDVQVIYNALEAAAYEPLTGMPVEAYGATENNKLAELVPFIAIPDGHTLLIASSEETLLQLARVYDGLLSSQIEQDPLLRNFYNISSDVTSAVLRFDRRAENCPAQNSRVVLHGVQYRPEDNLWQYVLNLGYPNNQLVTNIRELTNTLEYSTHHVSPFQGVVGQHSTITTQSVYENPDGDVLQFVLDLIPTPGIQSLPFRIAGQPNTCQLFDAPPANAVALALRFVPDLSVGRSDMVVRFGNVEQALYHAGLEQPISSYDNISLNEVQRASLNSTWRTALANENNFELWFGFTPSQIHQTVELSLENDEYIRILWGDFNSEDVEAALIDTGYVAVEQQAGTRLFTLRTAPEAGGFLLSSLAQTAASPNGDVLILSNQMSNIRIALDIMAGSFQTSLLRSQEMNITTQALGDATNVTLRRFANPLSGGLICGLPPYKVEAFANVLRQDGWHFRYVLGFNQVLDTPNRVAGALAEALETSDYPMLGPGSQTFGEMASVSEVTVYPESASTVILVDMEVSGSQQQASFFGQDLAQASLPPCALGDITQ